jgi:hypothetical protein
LSKNETQTSNHDNNHYIRILPKILQSSAATNPILSSSSPFFLTPLPHRQQHRRRRHRPGSAEEDARDA